MFQQINLASFNRIYPGSHAPRGDPDLPRCGELSRSAAQARHSLATLSSFGCQRSVDRHFTKHRALPLETLTIC